MKKLLFFLLFYCLISSSSFGQFFAKDTLFNKVILGLNPIISYREYYFYEDNDRDRATVLSFTPMIYGAYNLHKNLYVGADFGYEIFYSDFYKKRSFVEINILARYWIPLTINHRFFKKLRMYVQASYGWSNYIKLSETTRVVEYKSLKIEEDFIIRQGLDFNKYSFPIGLTFRLTRFMYAEMNWQYMKFINGHGMTGFMGGIGFNIGQKNNAVKKVF